jgi:hypothetical protein
VLSPFFWFAIDLVAGPALRYCFAAMPLQIRAFALFIALLSLACRTACAADPLVAPREGILVLRNGGVLRGRITRVGDRFIVGSGETDEVRLPARAVEQHCWSLEEAYEKRRGSLPASSAEARLDLAEWCLSHRLLPQAAEQLMEARRLDPQNPRNSPFERRLQMSARRPPRPAAPPEETAPGASDAEMEREIADLPAGAVEIFTSAVQPLLLNRCAANRCHGAASSGEFRLMRPPWAGPATRRLTHRNLHAALEMIDRERPEESPLLTMPLGPHGAVKAAVFSKREAHQHQRIAAWVRLVTSGRGEVHPASFTEGEEAPLQAPFNTDASPEAGAALGGSPAGAPDPPAAAGSSREPAKPSRRQPPFRLRSPTRPPEPRDPFDPELFNRRFSPSAD